jgi:hypothetical protein
MNAMSNELTVERRGWHELAPAELRAIAGGSPTLPLPPPSAVLSVFADPQPAPWFSSVLSLGGLAFPSPPPW